MPNNYLSDANDRLSGVYHTPRRLLADLERPGDWLVPANPPYRVAHAQVRLYIQAGRGRHKPPARRKEYEGDASHPLDNARAMPRNGAGVWGDALILATVGVAFGAAVWLLVDLWAGA